MAVHAFDHDATRRDGNGLQARSAVTVDSVVPADAQRQFCAQDGLAAQVAAFDASG